jgi:outer membrane protein W
MTLSASQRIYRILFFLFIAAGSIRLSAQTPSSDFGAWIVGSELKETTLTEDGEDITVGFDKENGFGFSFNHFWTDNVSTEIAAQTFHGRMKITSDFVAGPLTFEAGNLDAIALSALAQYHFNRAGRFSPYVGAGIARLSGDFEAFEAFEDPDGVQSFDLESEIAWTAAAGANVRITENLFLAADLKFIPWSAVAKGEPDSESLDIDPLLLSIGMKVRF